MQSQSYKLRTGVAGFVSLPGGGTMEITIPAGSTVDLLIVPLDDTELAPVRYGERLCNVPLRDLQRCGTLVGSASA